MMEYTIGTFVDKLLQEKRVSGLPDEVMKQLKCDLVDRAENIINAEILVNMPEESIDEFEKILDSGSAEEIQEFCRAQIPNIDEVTARGLTKLNNIYLANIPA